MREREEEEERVNGGVTNKRGRGGELLNESEGRAKRKWRSAALFIPPGRKRGAPPLACSSFVLFGQIHLHPSPLTSRLGVPIFDSLASSALPNILFLPPPYCRITLITTCPNHDYIPFPPRPKKSFASSAWEPPALRIRRPSFVGSRLLSLLHNPALLSSIYHEHNRHSYRANLFASHRISQNNGSLTTGLADIIDSKSQEIRPEDGEVYSKMEDLADELPESSPRFILLSYPLTLASGRLTVPYVMLYYLPVNCNPNSRMMYAGAVELMRNTAEVNRVIEVHEEDDIISIESKLQNAD